MVLNKKLGMVALAGTLAFPVGVNATEVLTSSARDYVESIGKKLSDYDMKEVHANYTGYWGNIDCRELLKYIPNLSEVIVDFISTSYATTFSPPVISCSGTALIPKRK